MRSSCPSPQGSWVAAGVVSVEVVEGIAAEVGGEAALGLNGGKQKACSLDVPYYKLQQ